MFILGTAVIATALAAPVHAESFTDSAVGQYWATSATNSSGVYDYNKLGSPSVSGGQLVAPIPTDSKQTFPDNEVINFLRTTTAQAGASAYYNGTLLGNLSGKSAVTATFNITNSTLANGAPIPASDVVGESIGADTFATNPSIRISFLGNGLDSFNNPNIWWSNATAAYIDSMNNGENVTLTVSFDPSQWSNYDGQIGTLDPTVTGQFNEALSSVSKIGLSFGSGYFYSDGIGFNTGGTADVNLVSFDTTPAAPLPATAWAGLSLLGILGMTYAVKRARRQPV
jgi:hypothetical protein